jgi:putative tryptophan/tyrosine transport system substrate-binding protein
MAGPATDRDRCLRVKSLAAQEDSMVDARRRELITLLGGAMAAPSAFWPLAARAQQATKPVIGYLYAGSPEPSAHLLAAFRKGLAESGYIEGQNVTIEYRWAYNVLDRLPDLAADLVRRQVAVMVTPGSVAAALAAKRATTTIPIVFGIGGDPVQAGLVASLNRPGANVTGVSYLQAQLAAKQLGLLHDLLPGARRFAVLVNPNNVRVTEAFNTDLQAAASAIGGQIDALPAATDGDIDTAFGSLREKQADALLVSPGPLFGNRRVQLATLAARHAMPAMYFDRQFAEVGGLISYGTSLADQYRQTGIYTGRALKGEKPADLPILRATKFELVINLKSAKTLGLDIPPGMLAIADEVIE